VLRLASPALAGFDRSIPMGTPRRSSSTLKKGVLTAYALDFPNQYLSVSLGAGLAIDDGGKFDKTNQDQIRAASRGWEGFP
jgi:hypothetical protein